MTMTIALPITKPERTLAPLWPAELNILFQFGHWATTDQLLSEALETLLEKYPELRLPVALELFRQDVVSLSRAAEIAGTDLWTFKNTLRVQGIPIVVEAPSTQEMDEMIKAFRVASEQNQ